MTAKSITTTDLQFWYVLLLRPVIYRDITIIITQTAQLTDDNSIFPFTAALQLQLTQQPQSSHGSSVLYLTHTETVRVC